MNTMDELMATIGYFKMSCNHGIYKYNNKYDDSIYIDMIKHEVTKTTSYSRGWLNEKEIDVVNKIINFIY